MVELTAEQEAMMQLLRGEEFSLSEKVNREKLYELFLRHRLLMVAGPVKELLKGEDLEKWKGMHQQLTLKSLKLSLETVELISFLKGKGIRAIPLKGPVLAQSLFGDVGLRHFNDIDLLVQKEDLDRTVEALKTIGYQHVYPGYMTTRQERIYSTYKKDVGLFNQDRQIFVELHYGIYVHELLRREDESMLLESTEHIMINNQAVEVLNKESTFIYLVYHGCLHLYSRLFWLRDVSECINRWEINHQHVVSQMRRLGLEKMLSISLRLAQHYFNIEMPRAFANFLDGDTDVLKLTNICHRKILGPEQPDLKLKLMRHSLLFSLKPGLRYKWTVLWSIFQRWRIRKFYGGH